MYEENSGNVTTALKGSSTAVFTDDTISKILALTTDGNNSTITAQEVTANNGVVTIDPAAELIYLSKPAAFSGTLTVTDAPVTLLQGTSGMSVNFGGSAGAGSQHGVLDRMVVGSAGSDKIVITDSMNSHITTGAGDTVFAGEGYDTIVAGMGDSTVEGGEGYAIVQLKGDRSDYVVTTDANGKAVISGMGSTTNVSGIQYIALEGGDALILAKDETEAAVTTLYETTFGRAADAYGLEFWFDMARAGVSLNDIAKAFVNSAEYTSVVGNITDAAFINNLFKQTYGHDATAAQVLEYSTKLANGSDRADLIEEFAAAAAELIAHGEGAEVVGSVTIIPGIFG